MSWWTKSWTCGDELGDAWFPGVLLATVFDLILKILYRFTRRYLLRATCHNVYMICRLKQGKGINERSLSQSHGFKTSEAHPPPHPNFRISPLLLHPPPLKGATDELLHFYYKRLSACVIELPWATACLYLLHNALHIEGYLIGSITSYCLGKWARVPPLLFSGSSEERIRESSGNRALELMTRN